MTLRRWSTLLALGWFVTDALAADLDLAKGEWSFAMDPISRGETLGWQKPDATWKGDKPHPLAGWDKVSVPHDFLSDPRYAFTGTAWYRRSVLIPAGTMAATWRLQFEQVTQRCRVWLNGTLVGAHEGGYTPFEFNVTSLILSGRQNFLVVEVDNRVRLRSLPGARSDASPNAQLFPWMNYGGILAGVRLTSHAPVYVMAQKIEAEPADAGAATFLSRVELRNDTDQSQSVQLKVTVDDTELTQGAATLAAHEEKAVELRGRLAGANAQPWSLAHPTLHSAKTTVTSPVGEQTREDRFGVRRILVRDGKFLINDEAMRWAGANRARGHPIGGGRDTDEIVSQDMTLLKSAGLVFARFQHTPPGRNLLDWADAHGMLLVLEVGVWGYPAVDLGSEELQRQFKAEMRELIALGQNHPSIVGWSVGNEYESWTPEGIAWTRMMSAYVKSLDATRPITFAAIGGALRHLQTDSPNGPHAFDYVDFISTNLYFQPEDMPGFLDPVHARWGNKPVLITEFGLRSDKVKTEQERLAHFDKVLALVRARPWVCGLSFWSFNDYASHYPGSGDDGYRRWGLVDEYRKPRALYDHVAAIMKDGLDPK